MKRNLGRLLLLAAAAAVLVSLAGCQNPVASVNGRKISRNEYYKRLEQVPATSRTGEQMDAGAYVLQQLINEQLIMQLAEKEKVAPTDAQVEQRYNAFSKQEGFRETVKAQGLTKNEVMDRLRTAQAYFNLQTKGVKVSDKEVKDFYNENTEVFSTPEYVMVSVIVAKNKADADASMRLLQKGVDFSDVVKQFSMDEATKRSGGTSTKRIYRDSKATGIGAETQKVLFSTGLGKYTKPVAFPGGQYGIFKIDMHAPKHVQKLPEVSFVIRQQLMTERGQAKNEMITSAVDTFRTKAKVKVNVERYKKALESTPEK